MLKLPASTTSHWQVARDKSIHFFIPATLFVHPLYARHWR